ncbi:MAG: DUF4301 family protein [Bacteroidales bacterium]|jgi:hypothetical protein|nr:DUF4301 family protein [Bacteroidales bacterium]MDG2080852.1 DUF4301 family protein [Bacteroidales bacterium]
MFTTKDINQINKRGLTEDMAHQQISNFEKGFPYMDLLAPVSEGNGLIIFSETEVKKLEDYFLEKHENYKIIKFVPASGAASRMFKDLYEFRQSFENSKECINIFNENEDLIPVKFFFKNIKKFAFYAQLKEQMLNDGLEIESLISNFDLGIIIDYFLSKKGMDYANLPKGLLLFHDYQDGPRTSIEEHLVEAAIYSTNKNKKSSIHLTVSPEHVSRFNDLITEKIDKYQKRYGVNYEITFSKQKPSTDTIAVTNDNKPFRNEDNSILFRPGGHGALIENLNDLNAEIIFIKNIDNVVPDYLRETTYKFKRVIGGLLIKIQENIFDYLEILDNGNPTSKELANIENYVQKDLNIFLPDAYHGFDKIEKIDYLFTKLNRPIRVCGMVKNEGEPGGGPFWVNDITKGRSLQIVESSQMNLSDKSQQDILANSSHFNPVDLVCGVRDFEGNKFNLKDYVDPNTGLITIKSQGNIGLKAQELPGLWNGAMSDWTTVFVETPLVTFNPVKTINDLLRPEHQNK